MDQRDNDEAHSFIYYQYRLVLRPKETIKQLTAHPDALIIGFKNILLTSLIYEAAIGLWWKGGAAVTAPPLLHIPLKDYYYYELFFLIPVFIAAWLLAAGIIYLGSKAVGGEESFDAVLGPLGVTIPVCAYFTLIPDLLQGLIFSTGIISQDAYLALTSTGAPQYIVLVYLTGYLVSNVTFFILVAYQSGVGAKWKAGLLGLLGFTGYFLLMLTYIR